MVSVSGGKDSTVLFDLAWKIGQERGRELNCFFLDEEVVYQSTVDIVRDLMAKPSVIPHWWQSPYRTTNATSYEMPYLNVWGEGEEWMRPQEDISFKEKVSIAVHNRDGDAFYQMVEYAESLWDKSTALLIGLRSEESLNRYGAVTRNPAISGVRWSSKSTGKAIKLYPLYDWTFEDIWTYLGTEQVPYNRIYDYQYVKGFNIPEMRVSSLIHENSHKCIADLQEFEPETYNALLRRVKGVHTAALYAKEHQVFRAIKLPSAYKSWKDYRDFILDTLPEEVRSPFLKRFAAQKETESVFRQQVRQLMINDHENLVPVKHVEREDPRNKWAELL